MEFKVYKVFLSYCWSDTEIADKIENLLKQYNTIELHRDKFDIRKWKSIKSYMQSISEMDYTILLISDKYLKSSNCMYEVLEVMRDRKYSQKIFPAVVCTDIYNPVVRAEYVKYWQDEYQKLKEHLDGIQHQNIGKLSADLKQYQDISSNIADFLALIADMNNPAIEDVCNAIKEKLQENHFLDTSSNITTNYNNGITTIKDLNSIQKTNRVSTYDNNILPNIKNEEPTDLEINKFISKCFKEINTHMLSYCKYLEQNYPIFTVEIDNITLKETVYKFYKSGTSIKILSIFQAQEYRTTSIRISTDYNSFNRGTSWNDEYIAKNLNGKLYLSTYFSSFRNKEYMSIDDVVRNIWDNYVKPYLG